MDDLISRQAAIDAFNKQIQQCRKALGSLSLSDVDKHAVEVKMASLRAYRKMLENLPTIQPEQCGDKSYTLWKESYEELKRRMDELTSCSDIISRQAALDAVSGCGICTRKLVDLPPAQPEPQWIPVSERLPEESGYYITSNEYCGVNEDFYYDGHFWNADKNAYEVLAWMPKPEHYKPNK